MAPGGDARPIRFGTSGWRGLLGDEVTLPRVERAAAAAAHWLAAEAPRNARSVWIAHDTRPHGALFADAAVRAVLGAGLTPLRAAGAVPTPAVARAIARDPAAGALVFTASHNPAGYHGMKVLTSLGGAAPSEGTAVIERLCAEASPIPARGGAPRPRDLGGRYRGDLLALIDRAGLRRRGLGVCFDAMHGAAAGILDRALGEAGVRVRAFRLARHPQFGAGPGAHPPDPANAHLVRLAEAVAADARVALGLATDGDGDRYGVLDERGVFLAESDVLALLIDHLAHSGRLARGAGVALSVATGTLPERVATAHGLRVHRVAMGFKHLTEALADGRAGAAGDESGGFAYGPFHRDKDGMLAGVLLAEALALGKAPLSRRLHALHRRFGRPHWGRIALPATGPDPVPGLAAAPPQRVAGAPVMGVQREDGVRLALPDGFLMLRGSGTEPVRRVYAEGPDARALRARLAAGQALLETSGGRVRKPGPTGMVAAKPQDS